MGPDNGLTLVPRYAAQSVVQGSWVGIHRRIHLSRHRFPKVEKVIGRVLVNVFLHVHDKDQTATRVGKVLLNVFHIHGTEGISNYHQGR